jgi:hypothetical protein
MEHNDLNTNQMQSYKIGNSSQRRRKKRTSVSMHAAKYMVGMC